MTDTSLEARRQEVVGRLRRSREGFRKCVSDVNTEVANRGSEWSIADLLIHSTGSYRDLLTRLLEEDDPDLGGTYDPDANWRRVIDTILRDIDGAIGTATDLTAEQLGRLGQRGGKSIGPLDVLTLMSNHYDEHLAQLRDEIRPREGLSLT